MTSNIRIKKFICTSRSYFRYPAFTNLLAEIVAEFGIDGASTKDVLAKYAKKYRLHSEHLAGEDEARAAIAKRRPIVARFALIQRKNPQARDQWDDFGDFFEKNPKGILTAKDIGKNYTGQYGGHAVLLVKCEPNALVFMNSWGTKWANQGYFRVENAAVLNMQFYDTFFLESDLSSREIQAYKEKGLETVNVLLSKAPYLKDLPYACPLCNSTSRAELYVGDLLAVRCPRCGGSFQPAPAGFVP